MTSLCLEPCEVMWHPTSPLSWPTFLPCFHDRLCKYNVHRAEKLCSLFTRMIPTARLKPGTHRIAAISTCKMNGGQPRNPVFSTVKLDPNMIWLRSALVRFWLRTDPEYKRVFIDPVSHYFRCTFPKRKKACWPYHQVVLSELSTSLSVKTILYF